MLKKLTKKERDAVVTKGYVYDLIEKQDFLIYKYLKSKDFVTKKQLKENDYVTKKYYFDTLEKVVSRRIKKQKSEFRSDLDALMEHHMHQLQVLFEGFDDRYVLRKELEVVK